MMQTTTYVTAKKMLARLLAKENIKVVHSGVKTATFSPTKRILTLPIWKEMSGDIYDLFILHEVSHALHTPTDYIEIEKSIDPENVDVVHTFFNIVEDARIEKMIKMLYPGGEPPMIRGYRELLERKFFGDFSKVKTFGLLDRLNVYFKVGGEVDISFSDEEQYFVEKMRNLWTFSDVEILVRELYAYAKDQVLQEQENLDVEESEQSPDGDGQNDDTLIDPDSKPSKRKEKDSEKKVEQPKTDQEWENNREIFVNEDAPEITYLGVPVPKLNNIVVPYKKVHREIRDYYEKNGFDWIENHEREFDAFRSENKPVVNFLLQEFQIHHAADELSKIKESITGDLDMNRLHEYKTSDDIFLRDLYVPTGKNHISRIFIDWSGSMVQNMVGTIHQLINLVMFQRQANIDFEVYTMGAQTPEIHPVAKPWEIFRTANKFAFDHKEGDFMFFQAFTLRTIFSSTMSAKEFKDACVNMFMLASSISSTSIFSGESNTPMSDQLGGTPLNEAIVAAMYMVPKLKKEGKKLNFIFLTDGNATTQEFYIPVSWDGASTVTSKYSIQMDDKHEFYIQDDLLKMDYKLENKNETKIFLAMLRERGVKTVGFFVSGNKYLIKEALREHAPERYKIESIKMEKEIEENYFTVSNEAGYDEFYILPGKERLKINTQTSLGPIAKLPWVKNDAKLVTTMTENGLKMRKQRVMLTRFIKLIS